MLHRSEGPVQLEHQHRGKPSLGRVVQQLTPPHPVTEIAGRGLVHVLPVDLQTLIGAELPKGQELGLRVLILIRSRDPSVDSDSIPTSTPPIAPQTIAPRFELPSTPSPRNIEPNCSAQRGGSMIGPTIGQHTFYPTEVNNHE